MFKQAISQRSNFMNIGIIVIIAIIAIIVIIGIYIAATYNKFIKSRNTVD